jgi:prepilin-type N-terminal cleavage/methylation domain-containing protein
MSGFRQRPGFTLIELLVVLGILVILSTIGVAAFISSGKVNRLVATEQLIGSQVRQARYTARATGQAVLLYISKDARTISGVSRISMWQGSCEAPYVRPTVPAGPPVAPTADDQPPFDIVTDLPRDKFLAANGRSGTGFCRTSLATSSDVAAVTLFDPDKATGISRNRQLTRSSTGPSEGFSLSCAVRPPSLPNTLETLPLLVIGPDTEGDVTQSFAGILLKKSKLTMYDSTNNAPVIQMDPTKLNGNSKLSDNNPERLCWEILGWVRDEAPQLPPIIVSSIIDSTTVGTSEEKFLKDGDNGGRWEEIGLIYTGSSLELYRDGIQVAQCATGIPLRIAGYKAVHKLFIGSASNVNVLGGDLSGAASSLKSINTDTIIDDIALFRLATDQPGRLATGVTIDRNVYLLIQPDGQIKDLVLPENTASTKYNSLKFHGVFAEQEDFAEITITPGTGLIESSKITLSKSAP